MAAEIALKQPSFALIRPPGHHAGRNFNGGFCFFNNMAIALFALLFKGSIHSALIVDIDLHYGNGTEDIVKEDLRLSFRNIHAFHREDFLKVLEEAPGTLMLMILLAVQLALIPISMIGGGSF